MGKSLKEMIVDLKALSEEQWGLYAFSRDPIEGKFTREQKAAYTKQAAACGRTEAAFLKEALQHTEPRTAETPGARAAGYLGLRIQTPEIPNGGGHVIFAQYVEPDEITIFMDGVKKYRSLMEQPEIREILEDTDIYELLLAHELFHGIEYQKRDRIYTRTEKVELWRKPFSNRSGIIALGEIAAMAFAKQWMELSMQPFVYDVVLMWVYEPQAAQSLYEEIMELTECV